MVLNIPYPTNNFWYLDLNIRYLVDKITDCDNIFRYLCLNICYFGYNIHHFDNNIRYLNYNILYLTDNFCYYEINISYCNNKTSRTNDKTPHFLSNLFSQGHRIANAASKAHWQAHKTHPTKANLPKSLTCPTLPSRIWADNHSSTFTKA